MKNIFTLNNFMQVGLMLFTMLGMSLNALKMPEYGMIAFLISQIFWFYVAYKAWKIGNQWGIIINTTLMTVIIFYGVLNYWIFG